MRRLLSLAFACLIGSLAIVSTASPKNSPPPAPRAYIKGVYNCRLSGGFAAQAASSALMQFAVDGKGAVTPAPGEFDVKIGQLVFGPANSSNLTFLGEASIEACRYTVAAGSYSMQGNGVGTLLVTWMPAGSNASSPIDCTESITTSFDLLVSSQASFEVASTDQLSSSSSCGGTPTYACEGSTLTGTCLQQSTKP